MTKDIDIIIDGFETKAFENDTILNVAERLGIEIPTLCHHKDLAPEGACRLCIVKIKKDNWNKFVTACNYPVWQGLEIVTDDESINNLRKMSIEALLGRAPNVPVIQELADKFQISKSRFSTEKLDESCILCGLCTRTCETYATSAISTIDRGKNRYISTFCDEKPSECVACGACVQVCPTGHIDAERDGAQYKIWDRSFELSTCGVHKDSCISCGACEEACPFMIPRVVLKRDGTSFAEIDQNLCKGCGVCVGACPTGSVGQDKTDALLDKATFKNSEKRVLLLACDRSNIESLLDQIPIVVTSYILPCIGRISEGLLLSFLARGYDKVLVFGRHAESCRLNGAEGRTRNIIEKVDQLSLLLGLGKSRVEFFEPEKGPHGAMVTLNKVLPTVVSTNLVESLPAKPAIKGWDHVLNLCHWLSYRDELNVSANSWLSKNGLNRNIKEHQLSLNTVIPYLDTLFSDNLKPFKIADLLHEAISVLKVCGVEVNISLARFNKEKFQSATLFDKNDFCLLKSDSNDSRLQGLSLVEKIMEYSDHFAWEKDAPVVAYSCNCEDAQKLLSSLNIGSVSVLECLKLAQISVFQKILQRS